MYRAVPDTCYTVSALVYANRTDSENVARDVGSSKKKPDIHILGNMYISHQACHARKYEFCGKFRSRPSLTASFLFLLFFFMRILVVNRRVEAICVSSTCVSNAAGKIDPARVMHVYFYFFREPPMEASVTNRGWAFMALRWDCPYNVFLAMPK